MADIETALAQFEARDVPERVIASRVYLILALRGFGRTEEARQMAEETHAASLELAFPTLQIIAKRCLALFERPVEKAALLEEALGLAREHGRLLDEAGCLLSLAPLAADEQEGAALWDEGARLLEEMGATAWLEGSSVENPPMVAMLL